MRVIAGTARGVHLESPPGTEIRPTLDRVREALFNILGDTVQDTAFLDLFAGTGAVGIEALSRGANRAVFADHASPHIELIKRNLSKTKLIHDARTVRCKLPEQFGLIGGAFDIVYADPPRTFTSYQTLSDALLSAKLLAESGRFILETPKGCTFDESLGGLNMLDTRTYGDTRLTIFT